MKKRTLAILVVSSIFFAALAFAATEDAFPQNSQILDSQTIRSTTQVAVEAEAATLKGPMKISANGRAYESLCIHGYKVNRRGWATLNVTIPREGDYVIWGRILGRDGYTNSFFVSIDGSPAFIWDVAKSNRWEWDRVSDRGADTTNHPFVDPMVFHFAAGNHTIVIGNREKETLLDRLIITDDLERLYYPEPGNWIKLDSPAMADVIAPGSTFEFMWRSNLISGNVNIDLSFDRGATYAVPVVHGTENDGSYLWSVPSWFNRARVMARISDASGAPYDDNRGYFSIVDPAAVSLMLQSPVGGESLAPNTIHVIRWKEYCFNGLVAIYLSLNNGATWEKIAENQNAGGENYWRVPDRPSENCLIKIVDSNDGDPWDVSAGPFTILPSTAAAGDGNATKPMNGALTALPKEFVLQSVFPNPFNPQTTISYGVAEAGRVTLSIYDALGRRVAVLADGQMEPGWYQAVWNGADFSTGIYTVVLQAGNQRLVQKMSLVK